MQGLLKPYIHQRENWPQFKWDNEILLSQLAKVRNLQGRIVGKMHALGFDLQNHATLETITSDVLKSSEIEGEKLDLEQVRSSIAKRLGMDISGLVFSERTVEGVVEMMMDATQNFEEELTKERLFAWHAALFPGGRSGMYKIIVGKWRDDSTGPMQVISGALGKEKVHFEAIEASKIEAEMETFLTWFNHKNNLDPVLKAAIAHFWFLTIHPFEDGNGRIARALADLLLSRADETSQRFYSMSSQICVLRKEYYTILEKSQQGSLDITKWITWFLDCLKNAILASEIVLQKVLFKHNFWNKNAKQIFNKRQTKILNLLIDGFDGKLNSSKWAKINKCSTDTALRDIQDLVKKEILQKESAGGRSTNYVLI